MVINPSLAPIRVSAAQDGEKNKIFSLCQT